MNSRCSPLVKLGVCLILTFFSHHAYANDFVGKIENNKPVSGVITGSGIDRYKFKVNKESSFLIVVNNKGDLTKKLTFGLTLIGPDQEPVETGYGRFFYRSVQGKALAGEWTAEVSRSDKEDAAGPYELKLIQVPGAKGTPLKTGDTVMGTITHGSVDVYSVDVKPTSRGRLNLLVRDGQGFFPELKIFSPNGEVGGTGCKDSCGVNVGFNDPGNYIAMVWRWDQKEEPGSYSLSLNDIEIARAPVSDVQRPPHHAPLSDRNGGRPRPQAQSAPQAPVVVQAQPPSQPKSLSVSDIFLNPIPLILRDKMIAPRRYAQIYKDGLFVTYTPFGQELSWENKREDDESDALAQVRIGDHHFRSDLKSAIQWWQKAAEQGDVNARNRLGTLGPSPFYEGKKYVPSAWYQLVAQQGSTSSKFEEANRHMMMSMNYAQATKLYWQAAEKGSAVAQYNLAAIYTLGLTTSPDYAQAAKWYGKAAEQGLIVAQNSLGESYEHGQGVTQNYDEALKWYEKAATSGYPQALYNLGRLAADGHGMSKDTAKAEKFFKQAADAGHEDAQGALYEIEGRKKQAISFWQRTVPLGNPVSLRKLVNTYRQEGIAEQDRDQVLEIYREAANEINPVAFVGLGDFFAKQNPPDYAEAYYWYRLAIDEGKDVYTSPPDEKQALLNYATEEANKATAHLSPEQVYVAKWRIDDRHPEPKGKAQEAAAEIFIQADKARKSGDMESALLYYLQAANKKSGAAQSWLGTFYEKGSGGVTRDIEKAISFYKESIRNGVVQPATSIGVLYQLGIGVPLDLDEAAKWYEMDASRGYKPAIDRLGAIYLSGMKDGGKKAALMYEKAAYRGVAEAYNALGMIYFFGTGVPQDMQKSLKWYMKSANRSESTGSIQAAAVLTYIQPRDYNQAIKILSRITDPVAYNNLGYMYEHGLGTNEYKMDPGQVKPTAIELYQKAADQCYGRAMYNIGRIYETGTNSPAVSAKPIEKNIKLARQWMESGAYYGSEAAVIWLDLHSKKPENPNKKIPSIEMSYPLKDCKMDRKSK